MMLYGIEYCAYEWYFKTSRTVVGVHLQGKVHAHIIMLLYLRVSVSEGLWKLLATGDKAQYKAQVLDTWPYSYYMVCLETSDCVIICGLLG